MSRGCGRRLSSDWSSTLPIRTSHRKPQYQAVFVQQPKTLIKSVLLQLKTSAHRDQPVTTLGNNYCCVVGVRRQIFVPVQPPSDDFCVGPAAGRSYD